MTPKYELLLYSALTQGKGFHSSLTKDAQAWRRSIRLLGGMWRGSFRIEGDLPDLLDWFYNRLGWHVEERSGGATTWEGMIYEMELASAGVRRRRSLENVANAVSVQWKDYAGRIGLRIFQEAAQSIQRYGRKELIGAAQINEWTADILRERLLTEQAWPRTEALSVGANRDGKATLDVIVCGYVFTLNWRYIPMTAYTDGGATSEVTTWLTELLGTYADWVTPRSLSSNGLSTAKYIDGNVRLLDYLTELVRLGDANGDPWTFQVRQGQGAWYYKLNPAPTYWLRQDGLYNQAGGRANENPFTVWPGVIRDLQYPINRSEPGAFLQQARDIAVDEVEVSADGALSMRASGDDSLNIMDAQQAVSDRQKGYWDEYWRRAWDEDRRKREAQWANEHPGVPFPG